MVRIFLSAASLTGVMQDRVASPSMITVQAPHNPAPQPNFVPTIPSSSRRAHSSGISGSTSTAIFRPLTRRLIIVPPPPSALELSTKELQIEDGWGGVLLARDQIGERRTIPMGISRV